MKLNSGITLKGIIIPAEWNDRGEIVALAIATYQEERFLIAGSGPFRELTALLRKPVVVSGTLRQRGTDIVIDVSDIRPDESKRLQSPIASTDA